MSWRDLEDVAGSELEFRAVGHLHAQAPGKRDPQVMVLTGVRAGDWSDVHGPAPAGLVGHAADDRIVELDNVDATVRNGPHVGGFTESLTLKTHPALPAANGPRRR